MNKVDKSSARAPHGPESGQMLLSFAAASASIPVLSLRMIRYYLLGVTDQGFNE